MKERSKFFPTVIALLLAFSVLLGTAGCPTSSKPLPRTKTTTPAPVPKTSTPAPAPAPNTTTPAPGPVKKPLPSKPAEMARLQKKLDAEAVKVPGVTKAATIISGTTAFVGLTLKSDANSTSVKSKVANNLKKSEPRLTSINVTTSPDLVTRISKVSQGIKRGTPLSSFSAEMTEITRRVLPTTG